MNKIFLALALTAASAAASATTVGVDYGYTRAAGSGPYLAAHTAMVSVKEGFSFGNIKLGVGSVQGVSNVRDNGRAFGVEYSYDFATPLGKLSPAIHAARITGIAGGNSDTVGVGATLRTPVAPRARLVTAVSHDQLVSGGTSRATTAGVGIEFDATKSVTVKGGYSFTRMHTLERDANAVEVGVEYKF